MDKWNNLSVIAVVLDEEKEPMSDTNQTPETQESPRTPEELRELLQGDVADLTTMILEEAQKRGAKHINALYGVEKHNHPEYVLLNLLIERLQESVGY